jgi:hypothetical protein
MVFLPSGSTYSSLLQEFPAMLAVSVHSLASGLYFYLAAFLLGEFRVFSRL